MQSEPLLTLRVVRVHPGEPNERPPDPVRSVRAIARMTSTLLRAYWELRDAEDADGESFVLLDPGYFSDQAMRLAKSASDSLTFEMLHSGLAFEVVEDVSPAENGVAADRSEP